MESTKQAIFKCGEENYGLDIMSIISIEKTIPIKKVANSPKNMKGIMDLRGDKIPVYSLRSKFGLEEKEEDPDTRLMITSSNGTPIALEVDKMEGIAEFEAEQILEVPPLVRSKNTSYMKAVTKNKDRLVILMDPEGILSEEEQNNIKEIIKKAKAKGE
jgi:purine-binding chemotaxis protein CheW